MSLEAKAGIVAAIYALQKLMQESMQQGNTLAQFATYTGLSAEQLQRWQYAARQAGVAGEEITGSIKSVQNAMTNMLLGKGAPEGLGMVANTLKNMGGFDYNKVRDTFYVMERLQKFAQVVPADVANNMLKSFGLSEGTINAMRRNAFNPGTMSHAPIYSDREVDKLQKVDVAWANLGQKIQMAIVHLNAKHGLGLVQDLSKITSEIVKLSESLIKLADNFKLFDKIGKVFSAIGGGLEKINDIMDDVKHGDEVADQNKIGANVKPIKIGKRGEAANSILPFVANNSVNKQQTISVNQTITHHGDAKDTGAVKSSHRAGINNAFRQIQPGGI